MLETMLPEIGRAIGKMFLNPLLYWIILIFFVMSYKRIRKERTQFGTRTVPFLTEGKNTFGIAAAGSIVISLLAVSLGIVMTPEIAFILIVVIVLLSITGSAVFLSASYTIGITFIAALLLPFVDILPEQAYSVQPTYYFGLALLAALFIIMEGLLLLSKKAPSYPELSKSERGIWIGEHHLKRFAFVPFLCLFPASQFNMELPLLPYIDFGGESYMLFLFPFILGFDFKVLADLPSKAAGKLGKAVLILGFIVLIFAVLSVYIPVFSIVTILIAILGREWIMYNLKKRNKYAPSIFHPLNRGAKVLATLPGTPAARLGIEIGETIVKVNGQVIYGSEHFYEALQNSGAFFKLEVLDQAGEIRFIKSAMYDKDHYELGVVFVGEPFRNA